MKTRTAAGGVVTAAASGRHARAQGAPAAAAPRAGPRPSEAGATSGRRETVMSSVMLPLPMVLASVFHFGGERPALGVQVRLPPTHSRTHALTRSATLSAVLVCATRHSLPHSLPPSLTHSLLHTLVPHLHSNILDIHQGAMMNTKRLATFLRHID